MWGDFSSHDREVLLCVCVYIVRAFVRVVCERVMVSLTLVWPWEGLTSIVWRPRDNMWPLEWDILKAWPKSRFWELGRMRGIQREFVYSVIISEKRVLANLRIYNLRETVWVWVKSVQTRKRWTNTLIPVVVVHLYRQQPWRILDSWK